MALLLTGCGKSKAKHDDNPAAPTAPGATAPQAVENNHNQAESISILRDDVPVETFLIAPGKIPARLKAQTLVLQFRSNASGARFECSLTGTQGFKECSSDAAAPDRFDFGTLADGKAYSLAVRAVAGPGREDHSPLQVSFLVDLKQGAEIVTGTAAQAGSVAAGAPDAADRLPDPWARDQMPQDGSEEERAVQVGGAYALAVPYGYLVTSYATNRTTSGVVRLMRLLTPGLGTAYEGEACNQTWEKPVQGPAGLPYCDGTPTEQQLGVSYKKPLPPNTVEIVRLTPHADHRIDGAEERLMVSTFLSKDDPAKQRLASASLCTRAIARGNARIPVLRDASGRDARPETFSWCEIRDPKGIYWWVGSVDASLDQTGNGPQLRMVFSVRADRDKRSGAGFSDYASQLLRDILVPLMPVQ